MKTFNRLFAVVLAGLLFVVTFSLPVHAVYFDSGNNLNLPKDKKINETAIVSGSSITVDSEIDGDLLCVGKEITINGTIKGDVLCAGETIKINGTVDGNVRVAGMTVDINGIVNRNVYAASQTFSVSKFTVIKGDIFFGVQNVDLRGVLGRDMLGAGENITISGSLLRNAKVAGQKILVVDPAKIGGNFEYYIDSESVATVSSKNVIGNILKHVRTSPKAETKIETSKKSFSIFGKIYGVLTTLLLGLALVYFLKRGIAERTALISQKPVVVGLVGLAVLILTPIVFVILMITVIGIPLAFVLILEYILSLMTASIFPALVLGRWLTKTTTKKAETNVIWSLLVGVIAIAILVSIPVLGILVGLIVLCLGLGSIFLSYLPS